MRVQVRKLAYGEHGGNQSLPTVWLGTGEGEYAVKWSADDAESVVALFLLVRGRHWSLAVPPFLDTPVRTLLILNL